MNYCCVHIHRIIHESHKHNVKWYMSENKDHIPFLQNSEAGRMNQMIKVKSTRIGINFIMCLLKPCTWKVRRTKHQFYGNLSLYMCESYYWKKLVPMTMETEKSHNICKVDTGESWWCSSKAWELESQNGINSRLSQKAQKTPGMSRAKDQCPCSVR